MLILTLDRNLRVLVDTVTVAAEVEAVEAVEVYHFLLQ
jgi:hypothetical protein